MTDVATTKMPVKRNVQRISELANIVNVAMIVASLALVALVLTGVRGDARLWLSVAVFVLGPGSGVVQFVRLPTAAMQLGILIALSAAIDILLGEGLLSIHNINGDAAACLLAGITCIRPLHLRSNGLRPNGLSPSGRDAR